MSPFRLQAIAIMTFVALLLGAAPVAARVADGHAKEPPRQAQKPPKRADDRTASSDQDSDQADSDGSGSEEGMSSDGGRSEGDAGEDDRAATVALDLRVRPTTIHVGEQATITAVVRNEGAAPLPAAELQVSLPSQLELVSSEPAGAPATGGIIHYDLGEIAAGAARTVEVRIEGDAAVGSAVVSATARAGDRTVDQSVSLEVLDPELLAVTSKSAEFLAQVGERVRYTVTVHNPTDVPLRDVVVLDLVPDEIHVVTARMPDPDGSVLIGSHRDKEDIVWVIGKLDARSTMRLPWVGVVERAGELKALNRVSVKVDDLVRARDRGVTYLARVRGVVVDDAPRTPIRKRVARFVKVPIVAETSEAVAGSPLPFTGVDSTRFVLIALMLVLAGASLWMAGRGGRARRALALAVLATVAFGACVDASPPRDDTGQSDEVRGSRITRPDDGEPSIDPADDGDVVDEDPVEVSDETEVSGGDDDDDDVVADLEPGADLEPDFRFVRRFRVVKLSLADLPINDLESRAADNAVTYEWSDPRLVSAASSTTFVPNADVEMLMTVATVDGAIDVTVVIRNITSDERVRLDGKIVHEVRDDAGRGGRLVSDPVDRVLAPGDEANVRFSYDLPDGGYTATATFEATG